MEGVKSKEKAKSEETKKRVKKQQWCREIRDECKRRGQTHPLLHIPNNLLQLPNLLPQRDPLLRRRRSRQLNLLLLHLQPRALNRGPQLLARLVPLRLVDHRLGADLGPRGRLLRRGDGGVLEGEGELEVRLGEDLRLGRVQGLLVGQGGAGVGYGGGVAAAVSSSPAAVDDEPGNGERGTGTGRLTSRSRAKSQRGDRACPQAAP